MIDAFITNLGRYNEGHLDGEYLKLPSEKQDLQALLKRIHVDGVRYEEVFITDYKTSIAGLRERLGEYESIDELNYLAALLHDLDGYERAKFEAALKYGEYTGSVRDLINLSQNLDCYDLYPDVTNEEELGYFLVDELCMLEIPEHLQGYFDYKAYGRDAHYNGGVFTDAGYIQKYDGGFIEHYDDRDDIPDEYRIFAYPEPEQLSIRDTLRHYQRMIADSPASISAQDRPVPTFDTR